MLAASFPKYGHPAVAWIALVPLLVAVVSRRRPTGASGGPGRAFGLGLVTGAVYFGGTLYWIGTVVRTFGGLNPAVAWLVTVLLVAYLALYPAIAALLVWRATPAVGRSAYVLAAFVWVAAEYARGLVFGGFPWVPLGASQVGAPSVAQAASLVGVYGLSLAVALVNGLAAWALSSSGRRRAAPAVAAVALVLAMVSWGQARIARASLAGQGTPLMVGIVQGNVPQTEKWEPGRAAAILNRYLDGTREAAGRGARLVLWPESATPFFYEEDLGGRQAIVSVARQTGVRLLIGSDQLERTTPVKYYNAAFLIDPDGRTAGVYRKMNLVPFGEYVPFKRLLFFVGPLIEAVSDFTPGDRAVVLPLGGGLVSTAICFESVFPDLTRRFVIGGSQLLTNLTNDAWYGVSSAPFQHFEQGRLRAIEQGRYLARAANTGISAIVDPYGRVTLGAGLFEPAVLVGEVRLLTGRTMYAMIGDLAAWLSLLVTALLAATPWWFRRATR